MSRKLTTEFGCACGHVGEVTLRKPSYHIPSVIRFNCEGCDSRFMVQFVLDKGRGPLELDHYVTPLRVTQKHEEEKAKRIQAKQMNLMGLDEEVVTVG